LNIVHESRVQTASRLDAGPRIESDKRKRVRLAEAGALRLRRDVFTIFELLTIIINIR